MQRKRLKKTSFLGGQARSSVSRHRAEQATRGSANTVGKCKGTRGKRSSARQHFMPSLLLLMCLLICTKNQFNFLFRFNVLQVFSSILIWSGQSKKRAFFMFELDKWNAEPGQSSRQGSLGQRQVELKGCRACLRQKRTEISWVLLPPAFHPTFVVTDVGMGHVQAPG